MSDFAQTVSCDRLPQRIAASTGLVALDLIDERVERRAEGFGNGPVVHAAKSVSDGPVSPG